MRFRIWQFKISRALGRLCVRTAALLTLGRMPPFVSTSAIVVDGGQVLVVIDAIRREPVLPGGHLKWREKPEHAVVREVREETGCLIETSGILAVLAGEEWAGEPGVVRVVYRATMVGGSLASSPEGEAAWIPIDELAGGVGRDADVMQLWLNQRAGESVSA